MLKKLDTCVKTEISYEINFLETKLFGDETFWRGKWGKASEKGELCVYKYRDNIMEIFVEVIILCY